LRVAGTKAALECGALAQDLEDKAEWMMKHIRAKEWLKEGFFNGYYDNDGRRVEGRGKNGIRMMLASQVFPVMSGTAQEWQVKEIIRSTARYLKDTQLGGYHLNTDFGEEQHSLGRAFSFVYGDKENGAYFNHMIVMYAYGLYQRGFGEDGWEVLHSIIRMALDTPVSKIFPCLPEYFDPQGRGMYSYLTGSASWFVLTMMTQAFGIKGKDGDLRIEPKLSNRQFAHATTIAVHRVFAGRKLKVFFSNDQRLPSGAYTIINATLNGTELSTQKSASITISRQAISKLPVNKTNELHISLG
jgi:cellobiose phosphorylase